MLTKSRYILNYKGNEKIINIKTDEDLAHWTEKEGQPEYIFREVRIATVPEAVCVSCEG